MLVRSVRPSDFSNICKFVASTSANQEPTCRALKITEDDINYTFNEVVSKCCTQTLSSLIEHDNKVVSVSLLLPYKTYNETQITHLPLCIQPLVNILSILSNTHIPVNINEEQTVYHFIVGTDIKHANKGYSRQVIKHSYANAINSKYNYVIADATNIVSQKILSKYFNYQEHTKLSYREFECFKNITCTQYVKRMFTKL